MKQDPVVAEIRKHRQEFAAQHGNDLSRICEALQARQEKSSRKVVKRNPKPLFPKTAS